MRGDGRNLVIKTAVWILCLAPLAWLLWLGGSGALSPDPGKALVDGLGLWALRLLLVVLLLRPLREATGVVAFIRVRRLFGLFVWFYATLHLLGASFYIIGWSWPQLATALQERTYVVIGALAWLLLLPLAVTSTRAAQRRLGLQWRRLHRLIYPAALLVCVHFLWLVRSDYREPGVYTAIVIALLAWRLWPGRHLRQRWSARREARGKVGL